jgi:hypothetical protein
LPETNILSLATAGGWAMAATEANGLYMCSGQPDHWTKV